MTRHARRVDENHSDIRDGLRRLGWDVADLSGCGGGVPDLMVRLSAGGMPYFLEIKRGGVPLSAQRLTKAQEEWHRFAHFITSKVTSLEEAVEALTWAKARHMALVLGAMAK
jgi:hypothetical protein